MLNFQGDTSKLFDAIGTAMAAFKPLPRTSTGSIAKGHTFQYAPLRKVVECIKTDLAKNSVSFMQALHTDGNQCALTLIVAGHGASVTSTFCFPSSNDPKKFGADSTYYRRYQLNSFFGLEGDPDADDFEDPVVPVKEEPVKESPKADDKPKSGPHQIKPSNQSGNSNLPVAPQSKESKAVAQLLMEAMQQLKWTMLDMDLFCKEHIEHFPGYVSPTKLDNAGKATLHTLLVKHKDAVPF